MSQGKGPKKSVAGVRNDGWQVHYEYEDEQRHSDQSRSQASGSQSSLDENPLEMVIDI